MSIPPLPHAWPLTLLLAGAGLTWLAWWVSGVQNDADLLLSSVAPLSLALRRPRGRPRKFSAPSRAVTLTLPESVIQSLSAIDADISRAVVQLAKKKARRTTTLPPADLAVYGQNAVITIRPTPSLRERTGVELVPLPDGRALISFDKPSSIPELELVLYDALDDPNLALDDRRVFEGIASILRDARRSNDVELLNRSIIVLQRSGRRRSVAAAAPPARRAAR